jgi:hypothetical protein
MIRVPTILRSAPAAWLAVPICLLAGYYVTLLFPADGYALDATAKATAVLPFVGAFSAACAAWEGSRLRRGHVWNSPNARSRIEVAAWCIGPALLVGFLAVSVAILHQLVRSDAGLPDARVLAIAAFDLIAYSTAGFSLGILLPFALAGPLIVVSVIIWLAFVPAMDPVWLRHLTGMYRDCCGLSEDLAPQVLVASAIVDGGIFAGALFLVASRRRAGRRLAAALAVVVTSCVIGTTFVSGMTYAPVEPRNLALLECDDRRPITMCTWPEHRERRAELAEIAAGVYQRWHSAGIDAPQTFSEASAQSITKDTLVFLINGRTDDSDSIIGAFSTGNLPSFPGCPGGGTGAVAFQYLEAWYAHVGGMTPAIWRETYETPMDPFPAVSTVIGQLDSATVESRRDWVTRAEQVSQQCEEWPPDLIQVTP